MSSKSKQIIQYVIAITFIFIVPLVSVNYFKQQDREIFNERVREDHEMCYQNAKRDNVDPRWCGEIRDAARLAYNESTSSINVSHLLLFLGPLLLVLIMSIGNLRKQVEELKEKIDA